MPRYLALICLWLFSNLALAGTIPFSLRSLDGLAELTGQVDKPECGGKKVPSVMIIGGTGLFSRNGFFGRSGTARDYLFSDLSKRLTARCIAVIRFDYRGVSCDLTSKASIATCLDQGLRASVSTRNILDDIQVIYDHLPSYAFYDPNNFVIFAHSEGSVNAARLVARKSIQPSGLLFMGGVTESPKSMVQWQIAGRPFEWAFEMDANRDRILTNEEISAGYTNSRLSAIYGPNAAQNFFNPGGFWTASDLSAAFQSLYDEAARSVLAQNDRDPYVNNGVVFSSYGWWKDWFRDEQSVLANLSDFDGPIEYHNGDIDSQTPGLRELAFLNESQAKMKSKPSFVIHPGKGHGLSSHSLYGPIDEEIADQLVDRIVSWTGFPTRRPLAVWPGRQIPDLERPTHLPGP